MCVSSLCVYLVSDCFQVSFKPISLSLQTVLSLARPLHPVQLFLLPGLILCQLHTQSLSRLRVFPQLACAHKHF